MRQAVWDSVKACATATASAAADASASATAPCVRVEREPLHTLRAADLDLCVVCHCPFRGTLNSMVAHIRAHFEGVAEDLADFPVRSASGLAWSVSLRVLCV